MPAFQVRIFRTPQGYLAWIDGLGTVEARTLVEARRAAHRFVEEVLGGAFPDRPRIDPAGAREVLEFTVSIRRRVRPESRCAPVPRLLPPTREGPLEERGSVRG